MNYYYVLLKKRSIITNYLFLIICSRKLIISYTKPLKAHCLKGRLINQYIIINNTLNSDYYLQNYLLIFIV